MIRWALAFAVLLVALIALDFGYHLGMYYVLGPQ
jgi:hypothetical protein